MENRRPSLSSGRSLTTQIGRSMPLAPKIGFRRPPRAANDNRMPWPLRLRRLAVFLPPVLALIAVLWLILAA